MVGSLPVATRNRPSGAKVAVYASSPTPLRARNSRPEAKSHSRMVPSSPAEALERLSGEKAGEVLI
jgi:hypothetical protein